MRKGIGASAPQYLQNMGNVVALYKGPSPPTKTYLIWAAEIDLSDPNVVELRTFDFVRGMWEPLKDVDASQVHVKIDGVTEAVGARPAADINSSLLQLLQEVFVSGPHTPQPVITFADIGNKKVRDPPTALNATSTNSVTPITYASTNPSVVEVRLDPAGWVAEPLTAGTATITASQVAGNGYTAATASQTVKVIAVTTPNTPTNLRTTTPTSSTIPLLWDAPLGTYTLQRAPVGSNGAVGAFTTIYTGTTASYQNTGLTYVTTYAYQVKVTVSGVDSAYSNVVQFTTAASSGGYDETLIIPASGEISGYGITLRGPLNGKLRIYKQPQVGALPSNNTLLINGIHEAEVDFEDNNAGFRFEYITPAGVVYGGASNTFQTSATTSANVNLAQ